MRRARSPDRARKRLGRPHVERLEDRFVPSGLGSLTAVAPAMVALPVASPSAVTSVASSSVATQAIATSAVSPALTTPPQAAAINTAPAPLRWAPPSPAAPLLSLLPWVAEHRS